jgi:hypothetical protein
MRKTINEILYWLTFLMPWLAFGKRSSAALDVLQPKFISLGVTGESRLSEAEIEIKGLKRWARTLGPLDRRAYLTWLSYYSREIRERRRELRKQEREKRFLDTGKFPRPPQ